MNRYIIADEAIQDLQDISDYFLKNNLETGEQFLHHSSDNDFRIDTFSRNHPLVLPQITVKFFNRNASGSFSTARSYRHSQFPSATPGKFIRAAPFTHSHPI